MSRRFTVSGSIRKTFGLAPENPTEAEFYMTDDNDFVMVGIGFRAYGDDVTTMQLLYARLRDDGQIDQDDLLMIKRGIKPNNPLEVWFQCGNSREVIVGCGVRIASDDVKTLHVHTRKIDPTTGRLIDPYTHCAGSDPNSPLEANGLPEQDTEHTLLRGVGIRCYKDDVTTLALYYGTLSAENG